MKRFEKITNITLLKGKLRSDRQFFFSLPKLARIVIKFIVIPIDQKYEKDFFVI